MALHPSFHPARFRRHKLRLFPNKFWYFSYQKTYPRKLYWWAIVRTWQQLWLCRFGYAWLLLKRKNERFWWFFWFLSVFVSFFKKFDDFRFKTLKYAPMQLFSWFSAIRGVSYRTSRRRISADRIERPKNRSPCDFGDLSVPHLFWAGVVATWRILDQPAA